MNVQKRNNSGFSRVELLVVVVTTTLIFFIGINNLHGIDRKKHVSYCKYNLTQIYQALTAFKTDKEDKFPWQVAEKNGGSAEYLPKSRALHSYKHWLTLSKYLEHPKVFRCAVDVNRHTANSWLDFNNSTSFSYFIATESEPNEPEYIISGDRNITVGKYNNDNDMKSAVIMFKRKFTAKKEPSWTGSLHNNSGILLMGNGSTPFIGNLGLKRELVYSKNPNNTLQFPSGK